MAQTCRTCSRTWDARATFCGACGDRLEAGLARPRSTPAHLESPSRRRRAGIVASVVALAAVGLAVWAVPAVRVERSAPVAGDVGVPEGGQLQSADGSPRPAATPPEITCEGPEGRAVDCVDWRRRLFSPQRSGFGNAVSTDAVLALVEGDVLRGVDLASGASLWQRDFDGEIGSAHADDHRIVVFESGPDGGRVHLLDPTTGRDDWVRDAAMTAHGQVLGEGLVVVGGRDRDGGMHLAARSVEDGTLVWESAPFDEALAFNVLEVSDRGVLATAEGRAVVLLDLATGERRWATDQDGAWVLDRAGEDVVVLAQPHGSRSPSDPNRAGDPGATLRGVDLEDGSERWQRAVRALEVPFGVQGELVLAPSTGRLTAVEVATGDVRWEVATEAREQSAFRPWPLATPAPDGLVVTADESNGVLHGRDAATGQVVWRHRPALRQPGYALLLGDRVMLGGPTTTDVVDAGTGRLRLRLRGVDDLSPTPAGPTLMIDHTSGYGVGIDLDATSGAS